MSTQVNGGVALADVAAQVGHFDTRMVDRFYGHLALSAQAESIRTIAPKLDFWSQAKVAKIRVKNG